jgi:hypothetical protein
LDEREGLGFLAADMLGIELLPSAVAPTEGHKLGKQVEDMLRESKEADDRLRGANCVPKAWRRQSSGASCVRATVSG